MGFGIFILIIGLLMIGNGFIDHTSKIAQEINPIIIGIVVSFFGISIIISNTAKLRIQNFKLGINTLLAGIFIVLLGWFLTHTLLEGKVRAAVIVGFIPVPYIYFSIAIIVFGVAVSFLGLGFFYKEITRRTTRKLRN